jgi:predicted transcriptional regulator
MSGSRLPGDSESNDRHKGGEQAAARLDDDLSERLNDYADANGETKSDIIREALDEFLPQQDLPEFVVPKDPELAEAYRTLARRGSKRVISVGKALDILSRGPLPNTDKELIKDDVLKELDDGGLIGVKNGQVAVHPLTPIDEVDTDADTDDPVDEIETETEVENRLDELAAATPVRTDGGDDRAE